ncbi:hypothetical protein SISNIDRAFT_483323 [Sistotremastrum niveocremeum HHB9708]|uniref:Transcription initiation factor TFIID subunit 1 histone acetyltransferase domain-containing protein n=1 Tax=Sistotremastrum niveocremeum HHB9708 TaxID=1314777 RepID=A0A164XES1_9AGAM|nr:hypothetical protein SISNIDRAFT_483323 [Sistotremastrum niveocremeum HHB9708]
MDNRDEETRAVSALTGLGLDHFLSDAGLPSANVYANQLGIAGLPSLTSNEIYNENFDEDEDEDAIGADVGEDMEEDVEPETDMDTSTNGVQANAYASTATREDEQRKVKKTRLVKRMVEKPKTVYERFPTFQPGKVLDFSELFKGFTVRKSRVSKRPFTVYPIYPRPYEPPKNYLQGIVGDAQREVEHKRVEQVVTSGTVDDELRKAIDDLSGVSDVNSSLSLHDRSFDLILLSDWEQQIIYSPNHLPENLPGLVASKHEDSHNLAKLANASLESGVWTQSIIWDPKAPFRDFTQLETNDDDVVQEHAYERPRKKPKVDTGPQRDRFNLSNDHLYELPKELGGRHRVRQTFGQLTVEHAYPAQKLQLPFYKTRLSKQEARSFHRPPLQFPANIELRFTKVRTSKKKKDKSGRKVGKGGDVGETLHTTGDLSLKDTSNFVLWEYSEEHPAIMSNFGMGSVLVNYYRKKDDNDETVPKSDLGEPFVLETSDDSPFLRFGYVYPGQTVPALYNNLVRAPLFRQKPYPTDFLVIRNTVKGVTKYFIRDIKSLFIVGQTFPVTEVPGPHSRKITTTVKNRLQIIAFKLLRKSPGERLKINRLMKYFPDQNELQMRQRLKEFMEYHRRGPHQGFWRLKPGWNIPTDAEMLKMLTPESVALAESMQVGQRHLMDSGYGDAAASAEDGDDANLSAEQQLAPWIISKNFLQATQNKAMLKLHGEGDPSGRGEAFSFIRVSMKEIFVRAGENYDQKMAEADNRPKHAHRYNVQEQQVIYKSEVERIWKAQYASLSRKDEPQLTDEDEENSKAPAVAAKKPRIPSGASAPDASPAAAPSPLGGFYTSAAMRSLSPAMSRGSSMDRDMSLGPEGGRGSKVLKIRRLVDGEWTTEIVRDSAVINAYVRRRQMIEEEATMADMLAPTGDAEKDKRARKRLEEEIARMKKNQERRLTRKNAKIVKEGGAPLQLRRPMKPDTTRRCGLCGQLGHMKTNRKCPKYAEANANGGVIPPTPSAPSPSASGMSPPPSGLGTLSSMSAPTPKVEPFYAGSSSSLPGSFRGPSFGGGTHAMSPLATSPPISGIDEADPPMSPTSTPAPSAPKIKLTIKRS